MDPADARVIPGTEHWDEKRTAFRTHLLLHGETYRPEVLFSTVPIPHDLKIVSYDDPRVQLSPSRDFCYLRRILPSGWSLSTAEGTQRGHVWWTTDVPISILANSKPAPAAGPGMADIGTYTWMSLTPLEFFTLRPGVEAAFGDVMIGGLGLGWLLGRVCAQAPVRRVRVVDLSRELIEWFRPAVESAYPAVRTRQVEWTLGNAWEHLDCFGPRTCNLMDIWPSYGDARRDARLQRIRRQGAPRHLWCWGEDG